MSGMWKRSHGEANSSVELRLVSPESAHADLAFPGQTRLQTGVFGSSLPPWSFTHCSSSATLDAQILRGGIVILLR